MPCIIISYFLNYSPCVKVIAIPTSEFSKIDEVTIQLCLTYLVAVEPRPLSPNPALSLDSPYSPDNPRYVEAPDFK